MKHGDYDPDQGVFLDTGINGKRCKGWLFLDGGGSDWTPEPDSEIQDDIPADDWLAMCEAAQYHQAREGDT